MTLADDYPIEWFRSDFAELGPEFNLAALAIARMWGWTSVLDVGCGPGLMLEGLFRCGFRELYGVDGSPNALEYAKERGVVNYVRERMSVGDLRMASTEDAYSTQRFGIVICTEVLEHIEPEYADRVVAYLAHRVGRPSGVLVATAAGPGQNGHHHHNCQPIDFWIQKFAEHALIYDAAATIELRDRWKTLKRLSHMPRNLFVLR